MKIIYYTAYLFKGLLRKISHKITDWACKNDVVFSKGAQFTMTAKVENISRNNGNIIIGENTIIEGRLVVFNYGGKINIGKNVYVGSGTNIWSAKSIKIGNNVLISHNVNIIDTNSHELDYLERAENYKISEYLKERSNVISAEIIIEDYAWISFGATILKSVKIGKGSIIAANSVVLSDVPAFAVVAGNPARVVKILET